MKYIRRRNGGVQYARAATPLADFFTRSLYLLSHPVNYSMSYLQVFKIFPNYLLITTFFVPALKWRSAVRIPTVTFQRCFLTSPFFFICILSSLSAGLLTPVYADPSDTDIRIVIDISGSMKKTDPNNLRQPALNLLVELLPEGSTASVWTFGRSVNNLVPTGKVTESWRQRARDAAEQIDSSALFTNLTGALDKAMPRGGSKDYTVIMLTDGRIDMDNTGGNPGTAANSKERMRLFETLMPNYAAVGAKVHTLALSDGADSVLLQQVAFETEGLFLESRTADDLLPAFLKAFDQAVPNEQVPIEDNQFEIDSSVTEFTALVFRRSSAQPTLLVGPDGRMYGQQDAAPGTQLRWHHDLNFDLITISDPLSGTWKIRADLDPNNRVQILSDLKLVVDGMSSSLYAGSDLELDIALTNEDQVVTESTILQLTDFSYQLRLPDGQTVSQLLSDPEQLPVDGVFRDTIMGLTQRGEYRLEVTAQGRTFQRRRVFTASLAEPMKVKTNADVENEIFDIRVAPEGAAVDTTLSRVLARIVAPDGSSVVDSLVFDPEANEWQLPLEATKGPGLYEVVVNIRGVSRSGKTFKSDPETIRVEFPLAEPSARNDVPTQTKLPEIASEQSEPEPPLIEETASTPQQEAEPELVPLEDTSSTPNEEPEATPPPPAENEQDVEEQISAKEQTPDEPMTDNETGTEEEGVPWWIYVILAVANLAIVGGVAAWYLSRRKRRMQQMNDGMNESSETKANPQASTESVSTAAATGAAQANVDTNIGDSNEAITDDFADVEIPVADTVPNETNAPGGDMDIPVQPLDNAGDDAMIPAASDPAADAWGEFDEDVESEKPKDDGSS